MRLWSVVVFVITYVPFLLGAEFPTLRKLAIMRVYRDIKVKAAVHNYKLIERMLSRLSQDCALPIGWCVLLRNNGLTCNSKCEIAELLLERRDIDLADRNNLRELQMHYKEIQPRVGRLRRVVNWALRNRPEYVVEEAEHNLQVRTWLRISMDQENYNLVQAILDYTKTQLRVTSFLHSATLYNDERLVRMFLQSNRFVVNDQNIHGDTALHLVQSTQIAQILLNAGARIDIVNEYGKTPLQEAPEIFKELGIL